MRQTELTAPKKGTEGRCKVRYLRSRRNDSLEQPACAHANSCITARDGCTLSPGRNCQRGTVLRGPVDVAATATLVGARSRVSQSALLTGSQ